MRSPQPTTVVIACPHCGTRYQVPPETLGESGRKVSCAECGEAWMATAAPPPAPEPDAMFAPEEEAKLDAAFAAEESRQSIPDAVRALLPTGALSPEMQRSISEIKAAIAPRPPRVEVVPAAPADPAPGDATAKHASDGRFRRRQQLIEKNLPAARLRRVARLVAVTLLVALVAGLYLFRTDIVRMVSDLAGVYSAIGVTVNVVGLEFSDVSTLLSERGDVQLISVNATIFSVAARRSVVPPVVVTLYDDAGQSLYQWSVTPRVPDLEPGEMVSFSAELASPPAGASRVKLSFAGGNSRSDTPIDQTQTAHSKEAPH